VCTFNRAELLPRLLERLAAEAAGAAAEIAVVDNASTDRTREVVETAAVAAPDVQIEYVLEPEQGLSRARNTGVAATSGEILVFIDDDALPDAGWLAAHSSGFADERIGAVGGPIRLDFDGHARPSWLTGAFEQLLGAYDLGPDRIDYGDAAHHTPSGGNMSFRRRALAEVGLFDVDLGRRGDTFLAGEEYELAHRLFRAGWRARHEPHASVAHVISADRLEIGYFRRRLRTNVTTGAMLASKGLEAPSTRRQLRLAAAGAARDAAAILSSRKTGDRLFHALRLEARMLTAYRILSAPFRRARTRTRASWRSSGP
jgi:GT2 family glycosyltransferase